MAYVVSLSILFRNLFYYLSTNLLYNLVNDTCKMIYFLFYEAILMFIYASYIELVDKFMLADENQLQNQPIWLNMVVKHF